MGIAASAARACSASLTALRRPSSMTLGTGDTSTIFSFLGIMGRDSGRSSSPSPSSTADILNLGMSSFHSSSLRIIHSEREVRKGFFSSSSKSASAGVSSSTTTGSVGASFSCQFVGGLNGQSSTSSYSGLTDVGSGSPYVGWTLKARTNS
jgi:hypothetical protein